MGEDIHQKTYVKSKIAGKYISSAELAYSQNSEHSAFQELIPDRFYNLYSCFGSRRADWKELGNIHYGMPDWFTETFPTESRMHDRMGSSWYGHCWFTHSELKSALAEYIEKLKSPDRYFDSEDDDIELEQLNDPETSDAFVKSWLEDAELLAQYMQKILDRLSEADSLAAEDGMSDIFDADDIVYMFWFDS